MKAKLEENFVNSDKEIIEKAKKNWREQNSDAFLNFQETKKNLYLFR